MLIGSPATGWVRAGRGNSLMVPVVVILPIWRALNSPNQRAPSGPVVMLDGSALAVKPVNSLMVFVAALAVEVLLASMRISNDSKSTNKLMTRICFMGGSFHMILGFLNYSTLLCIETEYDTIAQAYRLAIVSLSFLNAYSLLWI